jgi:perosamine synthetase
MSCRIPVSKPCIGPLEHQLVNECLRNNRLSMGPMVERFEHQLAERLGVRHVVTCSSGTTALHLALVALGVGPGDEVIVPNLTFVATANAVHYTGARVVLVDVLPETWCLDPNDVARKVNERTKAIIPVHIYGAIADLRALAKFHLPVIEDAAEALGAQYRDFSGPWSDCATFSFYANKVMTSGGEGGAVATNDPRLATNLRMYRGQGTRGNDPRYYHAAVGYNYRLTDLQAAIGVGQLSHLDEMLEARRAVIARYAERLLGGQPDWSRAPCAQFEHNAPWQFTFTVPPGCSRDGLAAYLAEHGVETRPVFVPMHRLPAYRMPAHRLVDGDGDRTFPVASRLADTGISLPTYPTLTLAEVDGVCDLVLNYLLST